MRWAFWRRQRPAPQRALPDDVGLPTAPRPSAAPAAKDDRTSRSSHPNLRTSGATPTTDSSPTYEAPLTAPGTDVDRTALAAAGTDLVGLVRDPLAAPAAGTDERTLAVAATGALAARLPALSGVDGDGVVFDEPADELLHAYADLLATRAQRRAGVDREDLLAVVHLAAAAAAVDAAADPGLLLLAGVPAGTQLRAAALLLAQTADDGGGPPDRLPAEVRELFGAPG